LIAPHSVVTRRKLCSQGRAHHQANETTIRLALSRQVTDRSSRVGSTPAASAHPPHHRPFASTASLHPTVEESPLRSPHAFIAGRFVPIRFYRDGCPRPFSSVLSATTAALSPCGPGGLHLPPFLGVPCFVTIEEFPNAISRPRSSPVDPTVRADRACWAERRLKTRTTHPPPPPPPFSSTLAGRP